MRTSHLLVRSATLLSLFTPLATAQQELFKLTSDAIPDDAFGYAVAVSGTRVIVGGSVEQQLDSDVVFVHDARTGALLQELRAADHAAGDAFGRSVALYGTLALVGAPLDDDDGSGSGSAYLFDVTSGQQLFKLTAFDGALDDRFGTSVGLTSGRAIVGSPRDDVGAQNAGSAYVFDTASGQLIRKLSANDGQQLDNFGDSVAIHGERALVGARGDDDLGLNGGSAYLLDVASGQQLFKLLPANGSGANQAFGTSVALNAEFALVGHPGDDFAAESAGSAHVFDALTGQELHHLLAADGAASDIFGTSVALSGERALIGAWWDDDNGASSGSAYLFDVTNGHELHKLVPSDGVDTAFFGEAVGLSGSRAVMGARGDDNGADIGSAYVFELPAELGSAYCAGDGSGAACPCANAGGPGEGCANSSGAGAGLSAGGSASASGDDLVLHAVGLLAGQPALLFVGNDAIAGGDGVAFGDGLRCAGVGVVRLGVQVPSASGEGIWGPGLGELGGWGAGDTRRFQAWYRDPSGPCGSGFNLTNGVELAFGG